MYPRQTGDAWEVYAPAKLNLYLEVLGKRDDGFHELETLMAPIRRYDRLRWAPNAVNAGPALAFRCDRGVPCDQRAAAPPDESNLVWRAAQLLARDAGLEPYGTFTLSKTIPVQAGLGGGSSDAAATLILANSAWGLGYSQQRLAGLAAQLGSDVPFFIAGGAAICRGRGELVEPVRAMPPLHVVVVAPPVGISTPAAFAALSAPPLNPSKGLPAERRLAAFIDALQSGSMRQLGRRMFNGLQAAAASLTPWVARLGMVFASTGCHAHQLTGSGSAYFGVMQSARHAKHTAARLSSANLGTVFASATCS